MKSVNTNNSVNSLIARMSTNDMHAVLLGAKSDIPILNLNAVIFGTKFRCTSPEFIELLKTKMLDSSVSFMGTPLESFATAALDILGVQEYNGTDDFICKLISSDFNL